MGDIGKFFNRKEFACKCNCGFDTVDCDLLKALEDLRKFFDLPTIISSGCRCQNHNQHVNGSPKSQHLLGKAADIQVKNESPEDIYNYLNLTYSNKFGIGLYQTFVHLDVRTTMARWEDPEIDD